MLKLYLWVFGKAAWYFLKRRNKAQTVVTFSFLLILVALAVISYFAGSSFVSYVTSFDSFSPALLRFTLLSLVSALSVLALVSFTIAFLKTLFEKNLALFLTSGKSMLSTVVAVFIGTLGIGSWPFLLISLPFFLGMPSNIFFVFLTHLILSVLVASAAGCTAILIQMIFGRSLKRILPFAVLAGLAGLFFLFTNVIYPSNLRVVSSAKTVSEVEYSLKSLPVSWGMLPSTLFVDAFSGNGISLLWLTIEAIILFSCFIFTARIFYLKAWQSTYEEKIGPPSSRWHFSSDVKLALAQKELLSILRDANAYLYLSFILFLVAVFIFFMNQTGSLTRDYSRLMPLVKIASYFSIPYIMLLVCLRFVFPALTLERPFMWLIATASNIRSYMVSAKWLFYQFFVFVFAVVLGLATGEYLKIPAFAGLGIFMTAVSLLIGGALQKELPRRDVETIATTGPGILLTVISLIIGGAASVFLRFIDSGVTYLLIFTAGLGFAVFSYYVTRRVYGKSEL